MNLASAAIECFTCAMPTESPIRDVMIEILTNELVVLDTIRAAGEVIAADASFNSRMAALQGHCDTSTPFGGLRLYQEQIDAARAAWSAFKAVCTPTCDRPRRSA